MLWGWLLFTFTTCRGGAFRSVDFRLFSCVKHKKISEAELIQSIIIPFGEAEMTSSKKGNVSGPTTLSCLFLCELLCLSAPKFSLII